MPLEPTEADRVAAQDYANAQASIGNGYWWGRRDGYLAGVLAERKRAVGCIPTNWLDSIFTGAPKSLNCKAVEWICAKIKAAILRGPQS